jgi:hypothetical protein
VVGIFSIIRVKILSHSYRTVLRKCTCNSCWQPGKGEGQCKSQPRHAGNIEAKIDANRERDREDLKGMMAEMNAKMDGNQAFWSESNL